MAIDMLETSERRNRQKEPGKEGTCLWNLKIITIPTETTLQK